MADIELILLRLYKEVKIALLIDIDKDFKAD
jgi:hypothetical protein